MRLRGSIIFGFVGLFLLTALDGTTAHAQSATPPPGPRYPLPTYDENWEFLRDTSRRSDAWDLLKYVPLSSGDSTFVSFGGEAREAYERFGNQDFGLTTPSPHGYALQRYLLHADVHIGTRVRLWGELNSSLEVGRVGGPRPIIDEDKLDLHQGFVEATLLDRSESRVRIRGGRQEMALGAGRLYALREGVNVPFSFDGARVITETRTWRLDAWAARPVINMPGVFDDESHHQFSVWGVYGTRPLTGHAAVDVYYLGLDRKAARFDKGVGDEIRHTLGVRVARPGAWAYDTEAMYQFGRFGAGDIRAWRFVAESSRGLTARWRPRIGLVFDAASGDQHHADPNLGTFNAFFQSGTYSGRAQLLGPNNSIRFEPSLTLTPTQNVSVSAGWGFYWRESEQDGLYGIPGQVIVPSHGVPGRYEGSRPIAQIDWTLTRHLSAHLNYIYVFNARFEELSVHGTPTMSYVSPWITYRF